MRDDLKPGNTFPDFELPDENGEVMKLSALMAGMPTALIFCRGNY